MAWTLYKEIKYDTDGIPAENLTDFPKLVSIVTDADIASELGGGGGIKFTSADGSADLDFGLYPGSNLAAGTVLARVKVTLLTAANVGDVICRLYYSSTESTTEDKAGTVSGSYGVFMPMEQDPSGSAPQMLDWVSNTNIGTSSGTMTSGDLVAGQVGSGLDLDGTDDKITTTYTPSIYTWTVELWIKPNGPDNDILWSWNQGGTNVVGLIYNHGSTKLGYQHNDTPGGASLATDYGWTWTADTNWHHLALVQGNDVAPLLYLDGSLRSQDTTGAGSNPGASALIWGGRSTSVPWKGVIDECRFSTALRSANWIAYTYQDEFANADTFTLSAEQGGGGGSSVSAEAALTTAAMTMAATATHTTPTYTASAAPSMAEATMAASATFTAPIYTAAAALTADGMTMAASAEFTAPVYTGELALTTAPMEMAASAIFATAVFSASAALTTDGMTMAASGTFTAPVYEGSAALTMDGMTTAISATFSPPVYAGTVALTTDAMAMTASATFTAPTVHEATAALTTAEMTVSASASFDTEVFTATAALVLSPMLMAATSTFVVIQTSAVIGNEVIRKATITGEVIRKTSVVSETIS